MSLLLSIPLFVSLNTGDLYSSNVGKKNGGVELGIGDKTWVKALETGVQVYAFEHCGKRGKVFLTIGSVIGYGLVIRHNMNVGKVK